MKKNLTFTMLMLTVVSGLVLMGCPTAVTPPVDDPPVVIPQEEMAEVQINFDAPQKALINQEQVDDVEKSISNQDLLQRLQDMEEASCQLELSFYTPNGDFVTSETVTLLEGEPSNSIFVPSGEYHLVAFSRDQDFQPMYKAETTVWLQPGLNRVWLVLDVLDLYPFSSWTYNLPGTYNEKRIEAGEAYVLADGQKYPAGWYVKNGFVVVDTQLPVWVTLITIAVKDDAGKWRGFDYQFSPLRQYDAVEYHPSSTYSDLELVVDFKQQVIANGRLFGSIQEAIDSLDSPIEVTLRAGTYYGRVNCYGKTVTIDGAGADQTILRFWGNVIYSSPWEKSGEGEKGGGSLVCLTNLQVMSDEADPPVAGYKNGVVFVEAGSLVLENVVINNNATHYNCVVTNYAYDVFINHSVLDGTGFSDGVVAYNEQSVVIANSIVRSCGIGVYADNGDVTTEYCVMWNVGQWSYVSRRGTWNDIPQVGCWPLNQVNPNLGSDYNLPLDSKLRGSASDGNDIGIYEKHWPTVSFWDNADGQTLSVTFDAGDFQLNSDGTWSLKGDGGCESYYLMLNWLDYSGIPIPIMGAKLTDGCSITINRTLNAWIAFGSTTCESQVTAFQIDRSTVLFKYNGTLLHPDEGGTFPDQFGISEKG